MQVKFIRWPAVSAKTGHAVTTLYNLIERGLFPPPVPIGTRTTGFAEHEVDAVNAARLAGKSDDEVHSLVAQLVAQRARRWVQMELSFATEMEEPAPSG